MSNLLPIIDLFPCIQGEGYLAGVPHILIRTSGCNLRCMFRNSMCDTAYSSWNPEKGKYSEEDVFNLIEANPQIRDVMITGGEPCIHKGINSLISKLKEWGMNITIETNGTLSLSGETMRNIDLVSLSPKLRCSTPTYKEGDEKMKTISENHEKTRINIPVLAKWILMAQDFQLKFVVSEESDLLEIQELIDKFSKESGYGVDILLEHVMLMPEGETREQLEKNRQKVIEMCIKHGYRYTDRLHIVAYDSKREA